MKIQRFETAIILIAAWIVATAAAFAIWTLRNVRTEQIKTFGDRLQRLNALIDQALPATGGSSSQEGSSTSFAIKFFAVSGIVLAGVLTWRLSRKTKE